MNLRPYPLVKAICLFYSLCCSFQIQFYMYISYQLLVFVKFDSSVNIC